MQHLKNRLLLFLEKNEISEAKFCRTIGVSRSYTATLKNNITTKTQEKIRKAYPDLNMNWLLTGEGEMLKSSAPSQNKSTITTNTVNNNDTVEMNRTDIVEILKSQQKHIDSLLEQNILLIKKLTAL
jgi:transcriptional regulator with XRE-family HTH domain